MRFLLILAGILFFSNNALAENPITPEGFFGEWRVYTAKEGEGTVCFMVSAPQHTTTERENNFLSVTHRPHENTFDTVAVMFGVNYHKKSRPTIEVDNLRPLEMKKSDDTAFIVNPKDEKNLIQDMIKGNVARTKGKSQRNTLLRETYSLKGFGKAYQLLNEKCRPQSVEVKADLQEELAETKTDGQEKIKEN